AGMRETDAVEIHDHRHMLDQAGPGRHEGHGVADRVLVVLDRKEMRDPILVLDGLDHPEPSVRFAFAQIAIRSPNIATSYTEFRTSEKWAATLLAVPGASFA